jgi:hypothetical protein
MATKSERLARELATEKDYTGELLHELGRADAVLRMLARAIVERDVPTARWMAGDILAPGQREAVKVIAGREGTRFTGWPIELLGASLVEHLDSMDAPNYVTMNMTAPPKDGVGEPRKLALTAQWEGGKTPVDTINELKAEIARLTTGSAR